MVMEVSPSLHLHEQIPELLWTLPGSLVRARSSSCSDTPFELLATEVTSSSSIGPIGNTVHGDSCCTETLNSMNICWLMPIDKSCQNL